MPEFVSDLIFSLGPNCRNTWNLRKYFPISKAYPFDWWITPAKSVLKMIEPGFRFNVRREHLFITPTNSHNTVYNHELNLLHHHDFPREWSDCPGVIFKVGDEDLANVNEKYKFLFKRFFDDVRDARAPVAVVNGVWEGFQAIYDGVKTNSTLNGFISFDEFAREVRCRLGSKIKLLSISIGEHNVEESEFGWNISIPDSGEREGIAEDYAEPVHAFRSAYNLLGLSFSSI